MSVPGVQLRPQSPEATIRLLEEELAQTNREVMALTLELEQRLEDLRAAERRYRRLAENAPDVILRYELTPRRGCAFVNPRVEQLTGYAPRDFYEDPQLYFNIAAAEDRPALEAVFQEGGNDAAGFFGAPENAGALVGAPENAGALTLRWVHRNGSIVWIEQHHVALRDSQGRLTAVECIARDITDRRQLEDQFRQAQKMEAIGRLAGGIAHDFNNLLTIINGYSSEAMEQLPEGDPIRRDIGEVFKAGERAAALTRQLLAFSRRQVLSPRVIDLNAIVMEMQRMLGRVLGEDIELVTALTPGLYRIVADPGQIEQVVMNLAVNARDAMPKGGRLRIETANVSDGRVLLAISDTGSGMDKNTRERIFEPFFTTKAVGAGTGLGLSTVLGIVQQSGGEIEVESEIDRGTTFRAFFPGAAQKAEPLAKDAGAGAVRGAETVLVVEDQDALRELIGSVLRDAGYTVLEAGNGADALAVCDRDPRALDLVITDLVMPGINGRELAERLSVVRPGVRILFMSGYSATEVIRHSGTEQPEHFLEKPFTPRALRAKMREVLDEKKAG